MKKIIIADNHPVVHFAITSILSTVFSDITIQCVLSAIELRVLLDAESPSKTNTKYLMAFVDLNLPDTNGVDLIQELDTRYRVPAIALSGDADPNKIRACVNSGAVGFIEKTSKMGIFPADVSLIL